MPPAVGIALADPRNVRSGNIVSDIGGYYDGQSIVCPSGSDTISCVFHHSHNHEGGAGLRVYHTTSTDLGLTWSDPAPVEASLTMPSHDSYQFVHPSNPNRVYVVYGYNDGQLHYADRATGEHVDLPRGDMQLDEGFRLKYSDDGGRSWHDERVTIPVRRTAIDHANPWKGSTIGCFGCDKPSVIGGAVYFAFQKTPEGGGETHNSECWIMRSKDLLNKMDHPSTATWETLPRGEHGLQCTTDLPSQPSFRLGEEPHIFQVDNNDAQQVMLIWRNEIGNLSCAYSSDGGETFSAPTFMTYDGLRQIKNPRGSITPHRFPNGQIALTFYNNSHTAREGYVGRRLYWLTVGTPVDAPHRMQWSEPELLLWWDGESLDDRPGWNADWAIVDGPGYPDFCELPDGTLGYVQSNKLTLRFHTVDPRTLYCLRAQHTMQDFIWEGLRLNARAPRPQQVLRGFNLGDCRARTGGFTIFLQLSGSTPQVAPEQVLIDATEVTTAALDEEDGGDFITKGFQIRVKGVGAAGVQLQLLLSDGLVKAKHYTEGFQWDGRTHTVAFTVDCGPRMITSVVDQRLCDGGAYSEEGHTVLPHTMAGIGGATMRICPEPTVARQGRVFAGQIDNILIYRRPLLTSEAISTGRALAANPDVAVSPPASRL